jgi:transcriptional regulator with XRE-family HTH domain
MSITRKQPTPDLPAGDFDGPLLCCWNMALASYTRRRREELGLSLERAAELAGLELSEWCALEAGWVPEDMYRLQAIAGTLGASWADYSFLALMADLAC